MSDQGRRSGRVGRRDPGRYAAAASPQPPETARGRSLRRALAAAFGKRRVEPPPAARADDFWLDVRRQLLELPQMRADAAARPPFRPAASFGRPPADRKARAAVPAPGSGRPAVFSSSRFSRIGLPVRMAAPGGHDWLVSAALLAFFGLGWVAAIALGGMPF